MHNRIDSGVAFELQDDPNGQLSNAAVPAETDAVSKMQAVPHALMTDQTSQLNQSAPNVTQETLHNQTDGAECSNTLKSTNGIEIIESQPPVHALDQSATRKSRSSVDEPMNIDSEPSNVSTKLSLSKGPDWPDRIPAAWDLLVASINEHPDNLALASIQQKGEFYGLKNIISEHSAYKASPYLRWSFAEFGRGLTRTIHALQLLGAKKGTPVFTFLDNAAEVPLICWATAALGCILTPLSPQILLNTEEAKYTIGKVLSIYSDDKAIVFAQDENSLRKISALNTFIEPIAIAVTATDPLITSFGAFLESGNSEESVLLSQYRDVAAKRKFVLFTSGTTSLPKAVLFDKSKFDRWAYRLHATLDIRPGDSAWINVPNNHVFFHLYNTAYPGQGGAMVFGGASFSAELFPTIMEIENVTHLPCPPTLAQAMLQVAESKGLRFPNVKSLLLGSAKVTGNALQQIIDGLGVQGGVIMYGGSETGAITNTRVFAKADSIVRNGDPSVGYADIGSQVKICAPDSRDPVPLNTEGEIHTESCVVADGYLGDPTHESFYTDEDGKRWYMSGDAGTMNEEGLVFVVGRVKDMIIRGGKNISPAAIEMALSREPETKDYGILVVGKLDELAGEVPIAVSQTAVSDRDIDLIQNVILQTMGSVYLPEEVLTLEQLGLTEFPKVNLGKISKSKLTKIVRDYLVDRDVPKPKSVHNSDELTEQVQRVWKRTVGHTVDVDKLITDFADSITLMRVRDRLTKETGVKLTLAEVLDTKTIRDQIENIRGRSNQRETEIQRRIPEAEDSLSEKDLLYLTNSLATARNARKYITGEISKFGLDWDDVYSISPASDFVQTFVQADICNASWSWKFAFALKPGVPLTVLRNGIETMLVNNKILTSFLLWNRKAFGSDVAMHVIPKSNDKLFEAVFKNYGSVANTAEFAKLVYEPYEYEMALTSGLLSHFLLFHIEETNQVGAIWVSNHATMDASYIQLVFEDLDKALGGSTIRSHIPYKVWADSYHSLRTSFEAQAAVNWQVNRLSDLSTHRDSVFPPLPRPHHFQSSQIHIQKVDDNGWHTNFHASGLTNLRQKHPGLSAPTIIKTAWSLMNMHRTGTQTALFSNLQADRKRFPFVPKALEALSPAHTFEASDVAGITLQDVINIIPLEPEETVLDFLYRVTDDQTELNEYAAAPLKKIMQDIGPLDSEILLDVFRSQIFNWTPGLGVMKAANPHENYEIYGTFIRPSLRLVINVDVSGPEDETVYCEIKSPLYDMDGLRLIAEDFEDFVHFLCNEANWQLKSTEYQKALRIKSVPNGLVFE